MILQKINRFLELIVKAKWKFYAPKQKDILVYDAAHNPFQKILPKKKMNYHFTRFHGDQLQEVELNFFILFKCLINLNLSPSSFLKTLLKYAKPKLILTSIDNTNAFYKLNKLTIAKTAFTQFGARTYFVDVFGKKSINQKKNKKNYNVDYMFVFNKHAGKIYSSFIKGQVIPIGSFLNNMKLNLKTKKKKEILWISGHRPDHHYGKKILYQDKKKNIIFNHFTYFKNDGKVIKWLYGHAKKSNIKFNILGRAQKEYKGNDAEKKYYQEVLGEEKINFIPWTRDRKTYEILNNYEYVFSLEVTLGTENLVKNGKTGFFFNRPNVYPINSRRFGYMENLKPNGPFWSAGNNLKEFERVFDFVTKSSNKNWKKARDKYKNKVMIYDIGNKKFLKIINKIIKN